MPGERKRMIKLFCPSTSEVVPFVAWEEERLDLGSIARSFGLDQATLKLNGHFISRGVDLIASSVTWKSLLSFFSARGLSTGTSDADALIVDGKLSKVGTKRAQDPADVQNWIPHTVECENSSVSGNPQLEDTNFLKRKKLGESNSGYEDRDKQITNCERLGTFGLKRKQCLEDITPPKSLRGNETHSGFQGR
ncbi:hypothetical protein F0562_021008 [Nyssa sinensis]|uniref:Uncharacterized protein n=1 Tax=Nyssa sinensis TaxID=561372 RepID=A0A5J5BNV1_9ASTE|nr:hypothetical protein F0562_021008 [Nyssa sinensis]